MKRFLIILFLLSLSGIHWQDEAIAQIDLSALTTLGNTFLDSDSEINTMHRKDDPFNPLRISVFMDSWLTEDIGVFLEFLWDAGIPPNGVKTKPRINGAYAVLTPFETEAVNFKLGFIPSPFGVWAPRTYADTNPLIGIPLMQHYLTSLEDNVLGESTDYFRDKRGVNDPDEFYLSVAYDACWPFGIEAFGFFSDFDYAVAITKESMSNPKAYNNDGVQFLGRFGAKPLLGLRLGVSGQIGSYLSKGTVGLPAGTNLESVYQKAVACDISYSFAHTFLNFELVRNMWENPNLNKDLSCTSWYVDAKQVLMPGLYVSVRFDQMLFDSLTDSQGKSFHWDNNITRFEGGFGYHLSKDSLVKAVWQHNDIEHEETVDLLCVQFVFSIKP